MVMEIVMEGAMELWEAGKAQIWRAGEPSWCHVVGLDELRATILSCKPRIGRNVDSKCAKHIDLISSEVS